MRYPDHQALIGRFVAICQADPRVVAAFIGGSHARGTADEYSDLDLYPITTDEAYAEFIAGCQAFIRLMGNPLFLEDFDLPYTVFFIFPDGIEGELGIARESQKVTFPPMQPEPMLQAVHTILRFYQELAPSLASAYDIPYPADLERLLSKRLVKLAGSGPI